MGILSKKKSMEIELKKEDGITTKAIIEQVNDPKFKEAMIKASSDSDIDANDPTKFTLLENLHNRDTADYYTYYKNKAEVEQVNRLETWSRLFPVVFGNTEKPSSTIRLMQEIVNEHCKDNMVNRASLNRKRESALVYAVKQDSLVQQTDKQVASFLGGKAR